MKENSRLKDNKKNLNIISKRYAYVREKEFLVLFFSNFVLNYFIYLFSTYIFFSQLLVRICKQTIGFYNVISLQTSTYFCEIIFTIFMNFCKFTKSFIWQFMQILVFINFLNSWKFMKSMKICEKLVKIYKTIPSQFSVSVFFSQKSAVKVYIALYNNNY